MHPGIKAFNDLIKAIWKGIISLFFVSLLFASCKDSPKKLTEKEKSDSLQTALETSIKTIYLKDRQGYKPISFEHYDSTYLDTVKFRQLRKGVDSVYKVIDQELKQHNTDFYKIHMEDIKIRKMNMQLLYFNLEKSPTTVHGGYRVKHSFNTLTENIKGAYIFTDLNLKPIEMNGE